MVCAKAEQMGPAVGWHAGTADEVLLKKMIEDHHKWTGSLRARELLDRWPEARGRFVKVYPHEYKRVLMERAAKAESAPSAAPAAPATPAAVGKTKAAAALVAGM